MGATVTLSTTTLHEGVGAADRSVKVASTSGLTPGIRLFVGRELMEVVSLGIDPAVNVRRGVDGTASAPHDSGDTIYIGRADQFYSQDPQGAPPDEVLVSPWINALSGSVWFAQGDAEPRERTQRWWQQQTTTYGTGALGVRVSISTPTSST